MAGNLKASELRSVLRRLDSANRALETCIQSFGECQKTLQKSIQCQNYLNHSCVKSARHESSALIIEGGRCASFDHLEEIKISCINFRSHVRNPNKIKGPFLLKTTEWLDSLLYFKEMTLLLKLLTLSIQPIKAGFVPNENARTVPGHAAI